jgi:SAM-dependent methyltransferase
MNHPEVAAVHRAPSAPVDRNHDFYGALWRSKRIATPTWFNTWPLLSALARRADACLEIGPGLHPRLPIAGTHFVDAAADAIEALATEGARATHGDLAALPFANEAFDLVAAFDVIEHVADGDTALDELARVLRPGGTLVASVPLHPEQWSEFDVAVGHHRRYRPDALRVDLARRGLDIEWSAPFGMKPRSTTITRFGLHMLARHPAFATRWYEAALPYLARRQPPLRFAPGLVADPSIADVVLICRRSAAL